MPFFTKAKQAADETRVEEVSREAELLGALKDAYPYIQNEFVRRHVGHIIARSHKGAI